MRIVETDTTAWTMAAFLLLALLAQVLLRSDPVPTAAPGRVRPDFAQASVVPQAPDLPAYSAIAQHPLFAPGAPAAGTAAADPAAAGAFSLLGLGSVGGQVTTVIRGGDGVIYTVKRGGMIMGWRVVAAGAGSALLVRGGVPQTLILGAPSGVSPPTLFRGARP